MQLQTDREHHFLIDKTLQRTVANRLPRTAQKSIQPFDGGDALLQWTAFAEYPEDVPGAMA